MRNRYPQSAGFGWLLCFSLALSGCVLLPFGVPPLQVQGGGGGRLVRPKPEASAVGAGMLRVGLHPMQLYPQEKPRWWDVGTGYVLDYSDTYYLHGGYMDGAIFVVNDKNARLGIHAQPRILVDGKDNVGAGLAIQCTGEFFAFADGDIHDSGPKGAFFGRAYGEGSGGFFIETSGAVVNGVSATAFGIGLQLRIPAAGGILWFLLK